jgi:16S rRNA processing protein RimM
VVRPHGAHGAVRVLPLGGDAARLSQLAQLWLEGEAHPRGVVAFSAADGRPILSLEGVDSLEAAEALRGRDLRVPAEERPPLADGRYYVDDLVGLWVVDRSGRRYGRVTDVVASPAHDLIEVADGAGARHLVPAVKALVLEVDLAAGVLVVDPLPGLLGPPAAP